MIMPLLVRQFIVIENLVSGIFKTRYKNVQTLLDKDIYIIQKLMKSYRRPDTERDSIVLLNEILWKAKQVTLKQK